MHVHRRGFADTEAGLFVVLNGSDYGLVPSFLSSALLPPPSLSFLAILLNFYFSHWEKYITGTMYLPWFYDFSQMVSEGLGKRG